MFHSPIKVIFIKLFEKTNLLVYVNFDFDTKLMSNFLENGGDSRRCNWLIKYCTTLCSSIFHNIYLMAFEITGDSSSSSSSNFDPGLSLLLLDSNCRSNCGMIPKSIFSCWKIVKSCWLEVHIQIHC